MIVPSVASTIDFSNLASILDRRQSSTQTTYQEELELKIRELKATNTLLEQQQIPMQQQLQQIETEKAVLQKQHQQSSSKIEELERKIQKLEAENVSLQQKKSTALDDAQNKIIQYEANIREIEVKNALLQ